MELFNVNSKIKPIDSPSIIRNLNNIKFTNRELDIISLLLAGKSVAHIAIFFAISPKTVEIHLRNIMGKLGCNSKESLLDCIDNSNKSYLIQEHYKTLLLNEAFEQQLKNIPPCTAKLDNSFLIIFDPSQNENKHFIDALDHYLKLIGFNTILEPCGSAKALDQNTKKIKQTITQFIYVLSNELADYITKNEYGILDEANNLSSKSTHPQKPIICISFAENNLQNIVSNTSNFIFINANEYSNQYVLYFEIIKKMAPELKIESFITEFNRQNTQILKSLIEINQNINKNFAPIKKFFKQHILLKLNKQAIIIPMISILLIIICLQFYKQISNFNNNTLTLNIPNRELLAKNIYQQKTYLSIKNNVFINVPPRNNKYIERGGMLKLLKDQLNQKQFGIITQTISGLGGVGKTQLATEYAYQAAERGEYAKICWIPCETIDAINSTYKEIAGHLLIDTKGIELNKLQTLVHERLASIYQNSKLLFILDNVPDYTEINPYLTKLHNELSPFTFVHVLITSRSQYWPENPLILDVFNKNEAQEFVKKYLPNEDLTSINKLTSMLHFQPLALSQAVSYIKRHTNIDYYLKLYTTKQQEFLNLFPDDKNLYHESLWKTWNISLEKLSNQAKELLFISAYLDPDEISLDLFTNFSIETLDQIIGELRKYSFIYLINNNKAFKIHRLLQEVIRFSINEHVISKNDYFLANKDNYYFIKTLNLVQNKFDFDYLQPKKWHDWNKYLTHVQSVANHAISFSDPKIFRSGLKLYIKYAMFLTYVQYDCHQAIKHWKSILKLVKKHYEGQAIDLILTNICSNICEGYNWTHQYQKTINLMHNFILPTYEHPLPIINNSDRELLNLTRVIQFSNDITDKVKNNADYNFALLLYGNAKCLLGFNPEALLAYQKALQLLAHEPIDQFSQYYKVYNLWILTQEYLEMGDLLTAEKIITQSFKKQKIYFGHPRLARAYITLANIMYQLGNFKQAIHLLNICNKIRMKNFSPMHIRHAETLIQLGFNNLMLGKAIIAKHDFTLAQQLYKLYFGNKASSVMISLGLWKTFEALHNYHDASYYMYDTLNQASKRYKNHMSAKNQFLLSQAQVWPNTIQNIPLTYLKNAIKVCNELFGANHLQLSYYYYLLGIKYEKNHNLQQAQIELHNRCWIQVNGFCVHLLQKI